MSLIFLEFSLSYGRPEGVPDILVSTYVLGLFRPTTTMPPKKNSKPPSWVASTAAPPKPRVLKVTVLNQITSSDLKGIFFTVEGIDQTHFDMLATKNFSSWEDVRITLGV